MYSLTNCLRWSEDYGSDGAKRVYHSPADQLDSVRLSGTIVSTSIVCYLQKLNTVWGVRSKTLASASSLVLTT